MHKNRGSAGIGVLYIVRAKVRTNEKGYLEVGVGS
jgi:hypothetical protein